MTFCDTTEELDVGWDAWMQKYGQTNMNLKYRIGGYRTPLSIRTILRCTFWSQSTPSSIVLVLGKRIFFCHECVSHNFCQRNLQGLGQMDKQTFKLKWFFRVSQSIQNAMFYIEYKIILRPHTDLKLDAITETNCNNSMTKNQIINPHSTARQTRFK